MKGYREQEKQGRSPEGDNAWIKSRRRSGYRTGNHRSETSVQWEEMSKGICVLNHEGDEDAVCNWYLWWWFSRPVVSDSLPPCTVAPQVPLFMGFPRQEHWSGLPFSSPGDLPNPGIETGSPALAGEFFVTELPRKPSFGTYFLNLSKLRGRVEDS